MFYSITGKLVYSGESTLAIDCSGVAFLLNASSNTLKKCTEIGSTVTLYTYLSVREDSLDLYGFYDKNELECYKLLISISGVGPKAALAILSALTPEALAIAVAGDDSMAITAAQGVGGKTASRIVLELKGKLDTISLSAAAAGSIADIKKSSVTFAGEEAVDALVSLGYSRSEASIVVGKLDGNLTSEQMIKKALILLAKNL